MNINVYYALIALGFAVWIFASCFDNMLVAIPGLALAVLSIARALSVSKLTFLPKDRH